MQEEDKEGGKGRRRGKKKKKKCFLEAMFIRALMFTLSFFAVVDIKMGSREYLSWARYGE
jgi:hypothetical protein